MPKKNIPSYRLHNGNMKRKSVSVMNIYSAITLSKRNSIPPDDMLSAAMSLEKPRILPGDKTVADSQKNSNVVVSPINKA